MPLAVEGRGISLLGEAKRYNGVRDFQAELDGDYLEGRSTRRGRCPLLYLLWWLVTVGIVGGKEYYGGSILMVINMPSPAAASFAMVWFFIPQTCPISMISHPGDDFLNAVFPSQRYFFLGGDWPRQIA